MPSNPCPSPPDAGRLRPRLAVWTLPFGTGYFVRGLNTGRYLPALPRRVLMMRQQVTFGFGIRVTIDQATSCRKNGQYSHVSVLVCVLSSSATVFPSGS